MERKFDKEAERVRIQELAVRLVNSEVSNAPKDFLEVTKSNLPVCFEFYQKYIPLLTGENDYSKFNSATMSLYWYIVNIARNSSLDISPEIFEVISKAKNLNYIDSLIASNSNPNIDVRILRELLKKTYDPIKPEIESRISSDAAASNHYNRDISDSLSEAFSQETKFDFDLTLGENIRYRFTKLRQVFSSRVEIKEFLKWAVKENILKRQQQLLKKSTDIFGGDIDPIYNNLDKYDVLKTCSELAEVLYPPNDSAGKITVDRRFEETPLDIINPGNKDGIPNLLAQMEVYINGLNVAQKKFFGRPRLLELCNTILQVDSFSSNKSYPDRDQYELNGILFQCLNNPFEDEGKNKNYKVWSVYGGYCNEFTRLNKISRESVIEKANSRLNNNSDYKIIFKQSDLNYDENSDVRSNTMDRILLSLQKDRNFLRKLLEELLKEPLPTTDDILFAENAELEAQKLSDPERQEEIWYRDMEKKVFQEELTGDSKQEEIECSNLVEKLKDNHLEYFWKENCVEIDKIFAGNKRILILINSDLKSEEGWVRPNWQGSRLGVE
jgi:hypothetical protein